MNRQGLGSSPAKSIAYSTITCVVVLMAAVPAASVLAAESTTPSGIAEQALRSLEAADTDRWEFVETTVSGDKTVVQRHDPTRPKGDRWSLVSVDGREPTAAERKEFTHGKDEKGGEDGASTGESETSEGGEVRAMIDPASLSLREKTPTHLVFDFEPVARSDEDARVYEHVDGTLRIARAGPVVESVELKSRQPFSPAFGVRIRDFSMAMTFAPVGEEGHVLPDTVNVRISGRAMLIKKIAESVAIRYSDYRLPE